MKWILLSVFVVPVALLMLYAALRDLRAARDPEQPPSERLSAVFLGVVFLALATLGLIAPFILD